MAITDDAGRGAAEKGESENREVESHDIVGELLLTELRRVVESKKTESNVS